ncbi:hypothetical protein MMC29_004584 [Sticta canariensis]|nr:hypothetical protein [Sticta canariensis]
MLRLLLQPTNKPSVLTLARPRLLRHAVAPTSRMTASVSQVESDPLDVPTPSVPTMRGTASKSVRPQHLPRSAVATLRTTASVNHQALDQLDFMKPRNGPSLRPRQLFTSEDASVTDLDRILENRVVLKLFTTESAKHRACVDIAEMLHMVSGSVFRMVLKQLPDFCVALNSLTREYVTPLAFMDAMLGGGPHSKPWRDHEMLEDGGRESMIHSVILPNIFGL